MESLLLALPALGCVVMMPAMVWLMARGMRSNEAPAPPNDAASNEEMRRLRDEVARLRSELDSEARHQESAGG